MPVPTLPVYFTTKSLYVKNPKMKFATTERRTTTDGDGAREKKIDLQITKNESKMKMNRPIHFYCRMWVEVKASLQLPSTNPMHTVRLQPHNETDVRDERAMEKNVLRICMIVMREMCSELKSHFDIHRCRRSFVRRFVCRYWQTWQLHKLHLQTDQHLRLERII